MQAVNACPPEQRGPLLSNVVLVGGNCAMPGFHRRVYVATAARVCIAWADEAEP